MKPTALLDEHMTYLDALRESGRTNMFGAATFLQQRFKLDKATAQDVLRHWMETFVERNPK